MAASSTAPFSDTGSILGRLLFDDADHNYHYIINIWQIKHFLKFLKVTVIH